MSPNSTLNSCGSSSSFRGRIAPIRVPGDHAHVKGGPRDAASGTIVRNFQMRNAAPVSTRSCLEQDGPAVFGLDQERQQREQWRSSTTRGPPNRSKVRFARVIGGASHHIAHGVVHVTHVRSLSRDSAAG